jgi:hypothetical protein
MSLEGGISLSAVLHSPLTVIGATQIHLTCILTRDGVLPVGRGHGDGGGVADALHGAEAHVVTEAQHVPAQW